MSLFVLPCLRASHRLPATHPTVPLKTPLLPVPATLSRRFRTPPRKPLGTIPPKMVKTNSIMLPLGTPLPPFSLPEPLTGNNVTPHDVKLDNGLLVVFMCNHCPFVVHLQNQLKALGNDLPTLGIGMVGISSNDTQTYPQDGYDAMKQHAQGVFSTFKYLIDETQEVAKAYHAACTPDIFLFDKNLKLVYRGQIDSSRPGNGKPIDGSSIRQAAKLLAEGKPIPEDIMVPSIGCNIKWRPGNEPYYFG